MHPHRTSNSSQPPPASTPVPSTLHPPNVLSNSLTHALALPPSRPQQPQQQQQQQQQFIQPHAIYHNPPAQPPTTTPTYTPAFNTPAQPPPQPPAPQSAPNPSPPDDPSQPLKRKRGRPKGSKTKNKRIDGVLIPVETLAAGSTAPATGGSSSTVPPAPHHHAHDDMDIGGGEQDDSMEVSSPVGPALGDDDDATASSAPVLAPPSHSRPLHAAPQDETIKDFYDFQWRVMSLCSVFYESAGDLVRTTDPAVLAQSMSLGSRADPLALLQHAKDFCDALLANPQSLAQGPMPPPIPGSMFPTTAFAPQGPAAYTPVVPEPSALLSPAVSTSRHPSQHYYPTPISPTAPSANTYLAPAPASYSRAPPAVPPPSYQTPIQQHPRQSTSSSLSGAVPTAAPAMHPAPPAVLNPYLPGSSQQQAPSQSSPPKPASAGPSTKGTIQSTHGAWSDEETERLKDLAERSRARTGNNSIDWDWTTEMFGETRSRHQILIKATNLGLKETSTHPSRLRKRLSATLPQQPESASSSQQQSQPSQPQHPHHRIGPVSEAVGSGGDSGRSSLGSNPSPPLGHPSSSTGTHHATGLGPSQMSPSGSVVSTPTLSHGDQQQFAHPQALQHRRPSTGSYQASTAMGSSGPPPPRETQPSPSGYNMSQPQAQPQDRRSASYSYPTQPGMPQRQQQQHRQQIHAPHFPVSPQVPQHPRTYPPPQQQQAYPGGGGNGNRPSPVEHQLALPPRSQPQPQQQMPPPRSSYQQQPSPTQYGRPNPQQQGAPQTYGRPPSQPQQHRHASSSSSSQPHPAGSSTAPQYR